MSLRDKGGFRHLNPTIALLYAILAMICVMVSMQPIFAAISFVATIWLCALMDGKRAFLKRLSWQIPLIALFALLNCIFVRGGTTALLEVGPLFISLESLIYGICASMMMVCAMNCFLLLAEVVSSDDAIAMLGNRLPVISLVASMSIRLVPKFQRRSSELDDIRLACTCSKGRSRKPAHFVHSTHLTHLLAASLEDSLICADSMRMRGWSSSARRTTYKKTALNAKSRIALVAIVAFGALCAALGGLASSNFQFYPQMEYTGNMLFEARSHLTSPALFSSGGNWLICALPYIVYAAYFLLPHFALFMEAIKWRR